MWAEEQFSIEFRDNADGVQNFINNISVSSTPASGSNSSGETLDRLKEFEDSRYIMWTINTNNYTKAYALKIHIIQCTSRHWIFIGYFCFLFLSLIGVLLAIACTILRKTPVPMIL